MLVALDVAIGPAPCDLCRLREQCAERLTACASYAMFLHGEGERHWRAGTESTVASAVRGAVR
jgi:hypothetical protein